MSLSAMPKKIHLDYSDGMRSFDQFMGALHERGWEIMEAAKEHLRQSRVLMVTQPVESDIVCCTPLTKLPTNIDLFTHRPCRTETILKMCLEYGRQISEGPEEIYVLTMTTESGIATTSLFMINSTLSIPTLDLVERGTKIERNDYRYLIHRDT